MAVIFLVRKRESFPQLLGGNIWKGVRRSSQSPSLSHSDYRQDNGTCGHRNRKLLTDWEKTTVHKVEANKNLKSNGSTRGVGEDDITDDEMTGSGTQVTIEAKGSSQLRFLPVIRMIGCESGSRLPQVLLLAFLCDSLFSSTR